MPRKTKHFTFGDRFFIILLSGSVAENGCFPADVVKLRWKPIVFAE